MLTFLSACRQERVPGRLGPNVVDLAGNRTDRLAPGSIKLRLAAVTGMFEFWAMRDPDGKSPIPNGRPTSWFAPGERSGLLAHTKRRPTPRSRFRLRTPRRLPRAMTPAEVGALLGSLRSRRDLTMAGLMLYCGLRSWELLALEVTSDEDLARGMRYPPSWDPYFKPYVTLEDLYHYPTQHFEHHPHQLTLGTHS